MKYLKNVKPIKNELKENLRSLVNLRRACAANRNKILRHIIQYPKINCLAQ